MITKQEIVYVTSDWFTENKTSTHHIAEELAAENRILYVEAAGMRSPQASGRDLRKIASKLRRALRAPDEVRPNLYVYSPLILPYHQYALVRRVNRWLLAWWMRRALRAVGFRDPIAWMFVPHFGPLLDTIPHKGVVYYVTDEYTATPDVQSRIIAEMEHDILRRADVVFTVSQHLLESKARYSDRVFISRHGVDVDHFRSAADPSTPIPSDIAGIPHPIAGFFGLIQRYIDLELLDHIAARLPHVSFVLLGRVAQDTSRLDARPNVHFLGKRDYSDLPGYLKAFDVCLLIYKIGEFSRHANPKKLREYIAGGKPVVSVRIGEVERYSDFVWIADDYDAFANAIESALREDSPHEAARRMQTMSGESWRAKVDDISRVLAEHIDVELSTPTNAGDTPR
jgi:glycosyltransferase involved in cell wall biosynthesis